MLWEAEIRLESQPRLIPLPHPFISPRTQSAESHSKAQFWLRSIRYLALYIQKKAKTHLTLTIIFLLGKLLNGQLIRMKGGGGGTMEPSLCLAGGLMDYAGGKKSPK